MKNLILTLLMFLMVFSNAQDHRTFQQINDSILQEAHTIIRFDKAFTTAMANVEANKKVKDISGEILIMPQGENLRAIIFSNKSESLVVGEMTFDEYIDSTSLITAPREATADELKLREIKHKVMDGVQAEYEVMYGDGDTYLNPIFIPYKETIGDKTFDLFKLYLTTETNRANTVPFGRDYMFIAKENGSIFYNLQFNDYMPFSIDQETADNQIITIEYPEKEHYITPTDIYLFNKYAAPKDILDLKVKSNYLGIYFQYNWDRETLDAVME